MFFTTKVAMKFVRSRFEAKERMLSLTKHGGVSFQLSCTPSDYDHFAQLISSQSGGVMPDLNFPNLSADAIKDIEQIILDESIFSKVVVNKSKVTDREPVQSLKYSFSIDNILHVKINPFKFFTSYSYQADDIIDTVWNEFLVKEINKRVNVHVTFLTNPAALRLSVRNTSKVRLGKNNDCTFMPSSSPPCHFDSGNWKYLCDEISFRSGYEKVDIKVNENYLEWILTTPIFFFKEDSINYEKLIRDTESFGKVKTTNESIPRTDKIVPVTFDEIYSKYNRVDETQRIKHRLERITDYINNCLRNRENCYYDYDTRSVSVFVPFEKFPEIEVYSVSDFIKNLYMTEGNFSCVKTDDVDPPRGTVFTFDLLPEK